MLDVLLSSSSSAWVTILVAVIGSGSGLWVFLRWFFEFRNKRKTGALTDGFRAIKETIDLLWTLEVETEACRVLVLKAENSGGVPAPGDHAYSSVIYEARSGDVQRVLGRWDKQKVDGDYAKILTQIATEGRCVVRTDQLREGCDLYDIYMADGITWSMVFRLGAAEKYLIYLSINFRHQLDGSEDPRELLTFREKALIRAGVNTMAGIMKRHHKFVATETELPAAN